MFWLLLSAGSMRHQAALERRFKGRVAWITGAGSGIGRALVLQLHELGAKVIASDIDQAALARLESELAGKGPLHTLPLDVANEAAFLTAAREVADRYGRIDDFFNNAGVGVGGEASSIPIGTWKRMFEVNVFGVINGIHAVYPLMIQQGFGHIINTGSVAGLVPLPAEVPYCASKHAVVGLSRGLALEARHHGVTVTTVCPGKIETPMYDTSPIYGLDRQALFKMVPRGVTPEQCAATILRGVERGREMVLITRTAIFLHALHRHAPMVSMFLLDQYFDRIRKKADFNPARADVGPATAAGGNA